MFYNGGLRSVRPDPPPLPHPVAVCTSTPPPPLPLPRVINALPLFCRGETDSLPRNGRILFPSRPEAVSLLSPPRRFPGHSRFEPRFSPLSSSFSQRIRIGDTGPHILHSPPQAVLALSLSSLNHTYKANGDWAPMPVQSNFSLRSDPLECQGK